MVQSIARPLTFEAFLDFDDGNELNEYELIAGKLVLMPQPGAWHEAIVAFLDFEFTLEIRRLKLPYTTRRRNPLEVSPGFGRRPDLAVIDQPRDYRADLPGIRSVPHMIVEVASGNWVNDLEKIEEYQSLGIREYWIVDYFRHIAGKYCQRGKGPKVIAFSLQDGEYQRVECVENEIVPCLTFPALKFRAEQMMKDLR
ncbi:MAG: Uma2 family endonuclease [Leptolyngbyaceae cyanobacterium MO_188.B28]|nr:Uma2 family endonuclease [Leptolyngbyaceae cyanobacterium MO_188.B28]